MSFQIWVPLQVCNELGWSKARAQLCLENGGILPGFLVVCGCDVQQDPQHRVQVCATALNLTPDPSLINLIAQIQRQLEWSVPAEKAGLEGKATAAQSHLAASDGFQESTHPLLKSREMQTLCCHSRCPDGLTATVSLATHPGQLSPSANHVLLFYWEGSSGG